MSMITLFEGQLLKGSVSWSTTLGQTEIFSKLLDWILMKFCVDNELTKFVDPLTFHLEQSSGQNKCNFFQYLGL